MKAIFAITLVIAYILLAFAFVSGIGVAIYTAAQGAAGAVALWAGFTTWLKMIISGVVLWIISMLGVASN